MCCLPTTCRRAGSRGVRAAGAAVSGRPELSGKFSSAKASDILLSAEGQAGVGRRDRPKANGLLRRSRCRAADSTPVGLLDGESDAGDTAFFLTDLLRTGSSRVRNFGACELEANWRAGSG